MSDHRYRIDSDSDSDSTNSSTDENDGGDRHNMLLLLSPSSSSSTTRRKCSPPPPPPPLPPPTCSNSTTATTTSTRITAKRRKQRRIRIVNATTNAWFILATISFWCSSPSSYRPPLSSNFLFACGSETNIINADNTLDSHHDHDHDHHHHHHHHDDEALLSATEKEQMHQYDTQYHEQQQEHHEQEVPHEEAAAKEEHDDDGTATTAVPDPTNINHHHHHHNNNIGVESSPERNDILSENADDVGRLDVDVVDVDKKEDGDVVDDDEGSSETIMAEESSSYEQDDSQQRQDQPEEQQHHQNDEDDEAPPVEHNREEEEEETIITHGQVTTSAAVSETNSNHADIERQEPYPQQEAETDSNRDDHIEHQHDASQQQQDLEYRNLDIDPSEDTVLEDDDTGEQTTSTKFNDGGDQNGDDESTSNDHVVHKDESSHSSDDGVMVDNEVHETPEDDELRPDDEAESGQQDNIQYSEDGDNMMGSNDDAEIDHSSSTGAKFATEDKRLNAGAQHHGEEETIDFDSTEATSADYVDRNTEDEQPNKEGTTETEGEENAPTDDGAETDQEAAEATPKEGSLASFMENAKNKNSQKGSAFEQQQQQKVRQNEFERQYHGQFQQQQQQQQQQQMPPPGGQQRQSSASAAATAKESSSATTQSEMAQGTSEESQTTSTQEDHEYSGEPWGLYRVRRRMPDLNLLYLLFQDLVTGAPDQRKAAMDEAAKHDLDDIRQFLQNDPLYDREVVEKTMRKSDAGQQRTQVVCDEEGCKEISYDEQNDKGSSSDDSTGPVIGDVEDDVGSSDENTDTDFVEGLDDIDKFFEPVDPQFVDVGASGFSMQEVIMGQGRRIIIKKAQQAVSFSRRAIGSLRRRAVRQWEKIQRATNRDQDDDNEDDRRAKSKQAGADFTSTDSDDGGFNWNVVRREATKVWNFGEELMERVVDWVDDMFNGGSSEDDDFDTFEKLDLSNLANTNMAGGADAAP
eukprot:CAMPEP_0113461498 /NCGR_PEP_ID=MMETSP0014_2-20120614/11577_1 /TAXON_ID=2857 /ORGANISM="Nitzschia sp." /LENGTH=974 /DNA_ID=CAMNT_0000353271 /DNA_START=76 /DNA_END=3000 /DNA_ORIENTATION=+ /assembly_acc=CAM_ASM_000159